MNLNTLSHEELYTVFHNGTLPEDGFNHEQHIRLAWYYLVTWPYEEARVKFDTDFRRLIIRLGAQAKYHKTITEALLQLIASHLDDDRCRSDWTFFKQDAEPLFDDARALLKRFYSPELLASIEAKNEFKAPDIAAMPAPYKQNLG